MQRYVPSKAVLQHLRQIKPAGCLFDLDGLLLDTEPLHSRAWAASIEHFGAHVPEGLLLELRGRNRFDNAAAVIKKLNLQISSEELLAIQQPISQSLVSNAQPMPGARELVELCHKKNIPMAIATSSGMQAVLVKLKPHPWLESIKVRVHGDDANIDRGKPAPDLFIEAAKQLNVDPKNCWAFEDSPAGATAAFAAGCEVFVLPAPGLNAKDYPEKSIILETLFNVPI
ncbi:HAD family phosphatase [Synechococcus lacustris C3-12m-Tous]|nr:HAD family phosphatase [Synechococcus lacustris C3-12m-Tous]